MIINMKLVDIFPDNRFSVDVSIKDLNKVGCWDLQEVIDRHGKDNPKLKEDEIESDFDGRHYARITVQAGHTHWEIHSWDGRVHLEMGETGDDKNTLVDLENLHREDKLWNLIEV